MCQDAPTHRLSFLHINSTICKIIFRHPIKPWYNEEKDRANKGDIMDHDVNNESRDTNSALPNLVWNQGLQELEKRQRKQIISRVAARKHMERIAQISIISILLLIASILWWTHQHKTFWVPPEPFIVHSIQTTSAQVGNEADTTSFHSHQKPTQRSLASLLPMPQSSDRRNKYRSPLGAYPLNSTIAQPGNEHVYDGSAMHAISCPTQETCFAAGEQGNILKTTDGGETWLALNSEQSLQFHAISCPTSNTCTIVGNEGIILTTHNGGTRWTPQESGTTKALFGISCPTESACVAVGDANLTATGSEKNGIILATRDGGKTWQPQKSGISDALFSVDCPLPEVCFAVGFHGIIVRTNDNGVTWESWRSDLQHSHRGITCLDSATCFATGYPGSILHTQNEGHTWNVQQNEAVKYLNAVSCPNKHTCIIAGESGMVLITDTSGKSWQPYSLQVSSAFNDIACPSTTGCLLASTTGIRRFNPSALKPLITPTPTATAPTATPTPIFHPITPAPYITTTPRLTSTPTPSAPTPTAHPANERCFAETDHCISGRIAEYWEQHGGVAVFGYPITPLQIERVEGEERLVQWFERTRLELHPENEQPYDVLVGRLSEQHPAYQPRSRATPQPGCLWFEETGHNVCNQDTDNGFKTYWQTHGLQDPTLTPDQRSLALYGLPLTEATEMVNPTNGETYLTQWFERTRLEWHPDNAQDYRVLPGLLGKELYEIWYYSNDHETESHATP
jgi:photosystem II stability/assembly factor-like uncharacterized protein